MESKTDRKPSVLVVYSCKKRQRKFDLPNQTAQRLPRRTLPDREGSMTNPYLIIPGLIIFLWAASWKPPRSLLTRRDFQKSNDCFTKGWDFELKVILQMIGILFGGCILAAGIMGADNFIHDMTSSKYPTLGQAIIIFITMIVSLMLIRRGCVYCCHKHSEKLRGR